VGGELAMPCGLDRTLHADAQAVAMPNHAARNAGLQRGETVDRRVYGWDGGHGGSPVLRA